jgi:hypothetical protein
MLHARSPSLWEGCDGPMDDGTHIEPHWDLAEQSAPALDDDHRVTW